MTAPHPDEESRQAAHTSRSDPRPETRSDTAWDAANRHETELERLDRNWSDLLQELRVTQTGVQLLTGFLLTLPFQQRFTQLDDVSRYIYLATVGTSVAATGALLAPVGIHRILFRQHARRSLVRVAHRCALAGLALVAVATCGVSYVVTSLVVNDIAGCVAVAVVAMLLGGMWLVVPLRLRHRDRSSPGQDPPDPRGFTRRRQADHATMRNRDIYLTAFDDIREAVHGVLEGLPEYALASRPAGSASSGKAGNSIAWLVWHLTRVQDDHVSDAMGVEQQWTSAGFVARFGLPFDETATGYGHTSADVDAVRVGADLLRGYHDAVHARTYTLLAELTDDDFDRVVDEGWDPPVTLGVRLVSVIGDDLQHAGQAAYLRGLLPA